MLLWRNRQNYPLSLIITKYPPYLFQWICVVSFSILGELLFSLFRNFYIWAATWQNQQNDCAPSEDSDQPWHPPSLIGVFAVRMKKVWVLSYPLSAQRRLRSAWASHSENSDQTGRIPRLIWVFAGRTATLLVLSCRGSFCVITCFLFLLVALECYPR